MKTLARNVAHADRILAIILLLLPIANALVSLRDRLSYGGVRAAAVIIATPITLDALLLISPAHHVSFLSVYALWAAVVGVLGVIVLLAEPSEKLIQSADDYHFQLANRYNSADRHELLTL